MNKIFLSCFIKLTIFLIAISLNTDAKEISLNNTDTLKQKGIVLHVSNFSKRVAILMRDTTLSGNRFDYRWHKGLEENGSVSKINYQLPAYLVDSTLAAFCDSMLIYNPNSDQIVLTSWPKKKLSTLTKKNIRLYIGYIDDKGNRNIVVQFVSLKEFKRYRNIYSEELFLVVPRKELHFMTIRFKEKT